MIYVQPCIAKLQPYEELLGNQLAKALSDQFDKYYDSVDDRGQTFFESYLKVIMKAISIHVQ